MELLKYDLDDLAEDFFYGSMPKEEDFCDEGYPVFSGYRIVGYSSKFNIKERTLVVVARGVGGTGDVAIAGEKTFLTNLAIAIPIKNNLANIDYLKYYLNIQGLRYLDSGAAQSQITINNLRHHKVFIPDIHVQNRIANVLATYDNLIEVNNKRIKVLEQMAENLYKEWFVRFRFPGHETAEFENGIPKGWKPGYLREIMSFSSGKPKPNDGTAFPVYGGNGITDWCNSYSHENVIILGRVGAYCGSTYFETGKCWISDNALYRISKRNDFKSFFYDYMLLKTLNLNKFQGGTGQPLITQGLLSRIKCILPSNDMVYSYDSVVRPIFDLIRTIHSKNNNLVKQRDLLLPRLMSGKLEV